jgi:hypothetical protein
VVGAVVEWLGGFVQHAALDFVATADAMDVAQIKPIASTEPLNFGLCPEGAKPFVSATEYGQIRHADLAK